MAQSSHAELLRKKMLAPIPPAKVVSPTHAEILLVNRDKQFKRHVHDGQ